MSISPFSLLRYKRGSSSAKKSTPTCQNRWLIFPLQKFSHSQPPPPTTKPLRTIDMEAPERVPPAVTSSATVKVTVGDVTATATATVTVGGGNAEATASVLHRLWRGGGRTVSAVSSVTNNQSPENFSCPTRFPPIRPLRASPGEVEVSCQLSHSLFEAETGDVREGSAGISPIFSYRLLQSWSRYPGNPWTGNR